VNTEITDNRNGWILFDAECGLCTRLAHRFGPFLHRHQFSLVPLQTSWVKERLAKTDGELLSEMRLLTRQGDLYGGADALIGIAQRISWTRPLSWLLDVCVVRSLLRRGYHYTARHRTCLGRGCRIAVRSASGSAHTTWMPAAVVSILAVVSGKNLPAWVWMWVLAIALFLGAKWITVSRMAPLGRSVDRGRLFAYLLLWPGMDAEAFCGKSHVPTPPIGEWAFAGMKTLLGAALLWAGVPSIARGGYLFAGSQRLWAAHELFRHPRVGFALRAQQARASARAWRRVEGLVLCRGRRGPTRLLAVPPRVHSQCHFANASHHRRHLRSL